MKEFFSRFGEAPLCNNKPERALHIGDFVFPLCYRCMMITIGIIIGIIILVLLIDKYKIIWKFKYSFIGITLGIPTVIDGVLQTFTSYVSTNPIRITTGFIAGLGLSILIMTAADLIMRIVTKKHLKI